MLRTEKPCQLQTPIKNIEFFFIGKDMKEIQLTQGQVALVDDEDFERVSQYKWSAMFCRNYANGGRFMARGRVGVVGNRRQVLLHRFIMDAQKGGIIDHIDGNPLNNTKSNLRHVTVHQNTCKTLFVLRTTNTSGFRGVCWQSRDKKWMAQIVVNRQRVYLGLFINKLDAAKAYNEAAKKYHGEFATLNPIEGEE